MMRPCFRKLTVMGVLLCAALPVFASASLLENFLLPDSGFGYAPSIPYILPVDSFSESSRTSVESSRRCVVRSRMTGLREGAKIRLWDELQDCCLDSAVVTGGTFTFDLNPETVTLVSVRGSGISRQFILEPGELLLEGGARTDFLLAASGTELNSRFSRFLSFYSSLYDSEKPAYVRRVVKYNRDNILSVVVLRFAPCITSYEAVRLIDSTDKSVRDLPHIRRYRDYRQRLLKVEPSRSASAQKPVYSDFTLPDADGKPVSMKALVQNPSNRYILLDFWASWCPACIQEMPELVQLYGRYRELGLEIVCVSWDKAADSGKWKRIIREKSMTWVNVIDTDGASSPVSLDYVVEALPVNVLIDCRSGLIVGRNLRGDDLLEALRPLRKRKE